MKETFLCLNGTLLNLKRWKHGNWYLNHMQNKFREKVYAIIGKELRRGNIWEVRELPRLKANDNVTKITTIDPKTGVEEVIFQR
ncbi:MAG: hypothetical protein J1E62_07150 [Lachnospiraceae bacterium]|nr:hypothetical protein [Lachnospiraceae bacterium]